MSVPWKQLVRLTSERVVLIEKIVCFCDEIPLIVGYKSVCDLKTTVRRQRYLQPHLRIKLDFRRFLPSHDAGSRLSEGYDFDIDSTSIRQHPVDQGKAPLRLKSFDASLDCQIPRRFEILSRPPWETEEREEEKRQSKVRCCC